MVKYMGGLPKHTGDKSDLGSCISQTPLHPPGCSRSCWALAKSNRRATHKPKRKEKKINSNKGLAASMAGSGEAGRLVNGCQFCFH